MSKRKLYKPVVKTPSLKIVGGVTYQWIPSPTVKAGGYWRRKRLMEK